jgi:hypothetical protein
MSDDLATWLRTQIDEDERRRTVTGELATWLLKQLAVDEQTARAMPHAIENLQSRWSPDRLIARCEAARKVVKLYTNALHAVRADSLSFHKETQDKAAEDVLAAAVRALAEPYADKPGYREEWRP